MYRPQAAPPRIRRRAAARRAWACRRPPYLRLWRLVLALASPLLEPLLPLFPILRLLILPPSSCILILLCSPSDQCTSERARSIKIIRWWSRWRNAAYAGPHREWSPRVWAGPSGVADLAHGDGDRPFFAGGGYGRSVPGVEPQWEFVFGLGGA